MGLITRSFQYHYPIAYGYYNVWFVGGANLGSATVYDDKKDSGTDTAEVLGDYVSGDKFTLETSSGKIELIHLGPTSSNDGFLAVTSGGSYYIVSDVPYNDGGEVRTNPGETTQLVCYASNTMICTTRGEVAVESLQVGDLAVTSSRQHRPIRWIGHRTITCRDRKDVMPVRIAAGAFGEGRPVRDLFVSPAHAICIDVLGEVLIPACRLINGTTITQADVESVTYWHVELDSHDILLAEGLPAESYLDCGNRRFFANADVTDLFAGPDARPEGPLPFCRPFHEAGPVVERVRADLEERAVALGWRRIEDTFAGLHVIADGRIIRPETEGLIARFVLPTGSRDVRLVSETSVPAYVIAGASDDQRLGVAVCALALDDGLSSPLRIALDDPRLTGFHALDGEGTQRWTEGNASLTAALWGGAHNALTLLVELAVPALPRWIAPGETAGVVNLADRRQA